MFDIGFSEVLVIMVVALVVIGPERLPQVARTMGRLWGRAQRYVNGVKADIERDMQIEELRQLKAKVQQEADAAAQATQSVVQTLDRHVQSLADGAEVRTSSPSEPAHSPATAVIQTQPQQQKFPID